MLDVTVNGERRAVAPDLTLHALIVSLGLDPERVAVELNRAIVKRDLWQSRRIDAGSEIEIVQFVGGG